LDGEFDGKSFLIHFIVRDENKCLLSTRDTITVNLVLIDKPQPPLRPFPNAFSPNGDGKGDIFMIENLPIDNCADSFEWIEIHNRWGKLVYKSSARNFAWDGLGFPSGVYYYHVKYRNSSYKGPVTLFTNDN
jgi:gliding motility-associated-like protein